METKKEELTFNIYAKEAEAAVLGSLMTFEDALSEVSLILTPEMFYDLRHQCIYAAILKTDNDGIPVDLVSVAEALKKTGNLERAGNYTYLSELTNYSGNVVRVTYYAQVVAQKFVQRELMKFGNQTIQAARDERLDVANVIAQTAANLDCQFPYYAYRSYSGEIFIRSFRARTKPKGRQGFWYSYRTYGDGSVIIRISWG